MEMFLMALALSLLGVSVSAMSFAAATREPEPPAPDQPPALEPLTRGESGFFVDERWSTPETQVPVEALLLQIERHVRLEHAAAEAFQQAPAAELLRIRTASPLVH